MAFHQTLEDFDQAFFVLALANHQEIEARDSGNGRVGVIAPPGPLFAKSLHEFGEGKLLT